MTANIYMCIVQPKRRTQLWAKIRKFFHALYGSRRQDDII